MKKNLDPGRPTVQRLVEIAREQHKKIFDKASEDEARNQKRIDELSVKEKELKVEIENGKKRLEKMIVEFGQLEKKATVRNLEEIKEDAVTISQVKSGKISMAEFASKGMRDEDIQRSVMVKVQDDLEKISDAVREKAVDVVTLELELSKVQNKVHQLIVNPVRTILSNYIELKDMLGFQLGPLAEEAHSSLNKMVQLEHITMLIQHGVSTSGGYVWRGISLKEAHEVQLNPILPKKEIGSLLEKLAEFKDDNVKITISFRPKEGSYFPGDVVEVTEE